MYEWVIDLFFFLSNGKYLNSSEVIDKDFNIYEMNKKKWRCLSQSVRTNPSANIEFHFHILLCH